MEHLSVPDSGMSKALELINVSKAFEDQLALRSASFEVRWGEVHALLGENGAGKSTIMNVATGVYAADEGETRISGRPMEVASPMDATAAGLGMVHQNFRLVSRFTVAQNILLACAKRGNKIHTARDAEQAVLDIGLKVGLSVDPNAEVGKLSIAERQRVEILKVLLLGARIIILDEPTAVLTDQESDAVLAFVRRLAESGHAVVLITHKLREVVDFSDRVTVMRQGATVLSGADTANLTIEELARSMVGEIIPAVNRPNTAPGGERLVVKDLRVPNPGGGIGVDGIDLSLRGGEILGIAGVGGNGQQQLADALLGLSNPTRGSIIINGSDMTAESVGKRRNCGLRAIPSDRYASGLIADLSISENLAVTRTTTGAYGGILTFSRARMRKDAETAIADYDISGATPTSSTRLLSGGNAQKLILARELSGQVSVLVAHSPTRGLDVRACNSVHTLIKEAVEGGAACLLISEDLEEILALSTRISVMSRGRIVGELPGNDATAAKIGELILGHA